MQLDQFIYELPPELIAQEPVTDRSSSRLLVVPAAGDSFRHLQFAGLVDLVEPGDLLVVNDTRVIPARLFVRKPTGGKVEILLERVMEDNCALAMLKSGKPVRDGQELIIDGHVIRVTGRESGFFRLRFPEGMPVLELFQQQGKLPLPPYIGREVRPEDNERYQTVYSRAPGAVAAPTAGLHFDTGLIDRISRKGAEWGAITLHVGAGTFQPVRTDQVENHKMHSERIEVGQDVCSKIRRTRDRGGRVIAVGTTVVRALESCAENGLVAPAEMDTNIYIYPGYQFQVVDVLVTNFHLPGSTLLIMVSAFAGYERIMDSYRCAIEAGYRFYSYGDAMFVERQK